MCKVIAMESKESPLKSWVSDVRKVERSGRQRAVVPRHSGGRCLLRRAGALGGLWRLGVRGGQISWSSPTGWTPDAKRWRDLGQECKVLRMCTKSQRIQVIFLSLRFKQVYGNTPQTVGNVGFPPFKVSIQCSG